jgi:hypothetical protein
VRSSVYSIRAVGLRGLRLRPDIGPGGIAPVVPDSRHQRYHPSDMGSGDDQAPRPDRIGPGEIAPFAKFSESMEENQRGEN